MFSMAIRVAPMILSHVRYWEGITKPVLYNKTTLWHRIGIEDIEFRQHKMFFLKNNTKCLCVCLSDWLLLIRNCRSVPRNTNTVKKNHSIVPRAPLYCVLNLCIKDASYIFNLLLKLILCTYLFSELVYIP